MDKEIKEIIKQQQKHFQGIIDSEMTDKMIEGVALIIADNSGTRSQMYHYTNKVKQLLDHYCKEKWSEKVVSRK